MQEAEHKLQSMISRGLREMTSHPDSEDEEQQQARPEFLTMHRSSPPPDTEAHRAHAS